MDVTRKPVTIRELTEDYFNDAEEGVTGYGDRLDIRPQYQREFVYNPEQRNEVIRSVMNNLPLSIMYWAKTDEGNYEVLDGQQRTISICEYVDGSFSVDNMYFYNQPADVQKQILDYELLVYECEGTPSKKLAWFKIINIAGEKLTDQELLNAVYAGSWTTDAKRYFSKPGGPVHRLASDYLIGSSIRQDYLETALEWAADVEGVSIEEYMGRHQREANAEPLWDYFRDVIDWTQAIFPKYRTQMRGLPWGIYFNEHSDRRDLDPVVLEAEIERLMADEEVTRKKGIYAYLLTGEEKHLSLRGFDDKMKREAYYNQDKKCEICNNEFEFKDMHGDHRVPWSKGGRTIESNIQMLCKECNWRKAAQ